jgi:O-antigen ligase
MLIFLAAVKKFKSYAKALGVAVVLSSLFFVFMPDDFSGRVGTLVEGGSDYNLVATEGRIAIWKRGLTFMATNPILGIGIGQFGVAEGVSKGRGAWMAAHNSFIQIGAELGAGGLALFCMLIWSAIKSLRNIQKADHPSLAPYATVATYLEVTIWSFCVMASFLSQAYSNLLYMLLASSVVMEILVKKDMDALAAGKGI